MGKAKLHCHFLSNTLSELVAQSVISLFSIVEAGESVFVQLLCCKMLFLFHHGFCQLLHISHLGACRSGRLLSPSQKRSHFLLGELIVGRRMKAQEEMTFLVLSNGSLYKSTDLYFLSSKKLLDLHDNYRLFF